MGELARIAAAEVIGHQQFLNASETDGMRQRWPTLCLTISSQSHSIGLILVIGLLLLSLFFFHVEDAPASRLFAPEQSGCRLVLSSPISARESHMAIEERETGTLISLDARIVVGGSN
jgi:hypothetical protein